jgi:hypothetical protein
MKAIFNKFLSLKRMHTYTIIRGTVLKGRLLLLSKLVLKHKYNAKGEVIHKKVRLCIRGDKQTPNINYFETFALVVQYDTFRFLMAKVAAKDLKLDYIDVETIFLNPPLQE